MEKIIEIEIGIENRMKQSTSTVLQSVLAITLLLYLSGCSGDNTLLVTQADFDKVTDEMFTPTSFTRRGGSSTGGADQVGFTAVYDPQDSDAEFHFDFSAWNVFLNGKEKFTDHGHGGSPGLHWRQTWDNRSRSILVDAVAMKDRTIVVTYYEALHSTLHQD